MDFEEKDTYSASASRQKPLMLFCDECNNLLYPMENREANTLNYVCRTCNFIAPTINSLIYKHKIIAAAGKGSSRMIINKDVIYDPTMPRTFGVTKVCPKCAGSEAIYFTNFPEPQSLRLYFVCCNVKCRFVWKQKLAKSTGRNDPSSLNINFAGNDEIDDEIPEF